MSAIFHTSARRLFRRALPAIAAAAALQAMAQETAKALPEVAVVGQAASLDNALDVQQAADHIVSAVHADGIGQLPDANAAEALQRVPGLSVERDQGEGRYVRVRGLGPDLNAVTINGSLVPAPESDRRAVTLDVLPSGLIRSVEVSKTLLPSQDANSIGGTVEVKTISAFDHPGRFLAFEGGASHDSNTSQNSPNFSGAWSDRFLDGKLGIAFGVSASKRKFGSDNVETGGAWDFSGAQPAMEEFQRRDYQITREREGGVLNFDYRPQQGESYYLRTLYSRYADEEVRQRHNIEFDTPMLSGALGDAEASRELKARKETQDISSIVLGGEKKFQDWTVTAAFGTSSASQKTPNAIDAAKFESGVTYTAGYNGTRIPTLIGGAGMNNAADYELDSVELSSQTARDRERNIRLDLGRDKLKILGLDSELKFGGKMSRRKKSNELTAWEVDGGDFGNPALSGYTGSAVSYPWGSFGPSISPEALSNFLSGVNLANYVNEEESRINDFTMHEDINAAYVQNTFNSGLWRVLVGMRYEGTDFRAQGTGLDNGTFNNLETQRKYHHWLPALHVRRDLDGDTTVRSALTHSVVRPTFGQLAPGYVIDGTEASFGNPDLQAMKSRNLDLGIEQRLGHASVLSAYAFFKDINHFVYNTDLAGSGAWATFDQANTYANGDNAKVKGIELSYAQSFRQLPAPWNGLLLASNATFSDSKARIAGYSNAVAVSRDIPLPSQSDRTLNFMVGYEAGPWSTRLAANYKSRYLLEVTNVGSADGDLYVEAQTFYDLSARYNFSKQVQLVFEALNLGDETYHVYTGRPGLNAQHELYGRTFRVALKFAAF